MERTPEEQSELNTLGDNIRKIRLENHLTQAELAAELDIEKPNLSRIENGKTNPTFLTLKKIARKLYVHVCAFIPGTKNEK